MPLVGNIAVLQLEFDSGFTISVWNSVTLSDSFLDPLGAFDFEVSPRREDIAEYAKQIKKGRRVVARINGNPQGTWVIVTVRTKIDRAGVTYGISAKSLLVNAYQGSVDPEISKHYQSDTPVSEVILEALGPYGFTEIKADPERDVGAISGKPIPGRKTDFKAAKLKVKDAQAQEGESAYQFCSRIFNRLGVALRVDVEGVLLLSAPDYAQEIVSNLVHDLDRSHKGDRMLDGITIVSTNDNLFSEYVVRGKGIASSKGQVRSSRPAIRLASPALVGDRPGDAPFANFPLTELDETLANYASDFQPYKPKFAVDKHARDAKRCLSVAKLMFGLKASKGFQIRCTVDGWLSGITGRVWAVDTMANCFIESADISDDFWISERVLREDRSGGQRTDLVLIAKNSLVLGEIPK